MGFLSYFCPKQNLPQHMASTWTFYLTFVQGHSAKLQPPNFQFKS